MPVSSYFEWIVLDNTPMTEAHIYVEKRVGDQAVLGIAGLVETHGEKKRWSWEAFNDNAGATDSRSLSMLRVEIALGVMPISLPRNIRIVEEGEKNE